MNETEKAYAASSGNLTWLPLKPQKGQRCFAGQPHLASPQTAKMALFLTAINKQPYREFQ